MRARAVLGVWLLLLALLGLEFAAGSFGAPIVAGGMAVVVALTFMRLARTPGVPGAFALAALFWLVVLLGLGSLDSATRHDIGVANDTLRWRQVCWARRAVAHPLSRPSASAGAKAASVIRQAIGGPQPPPAGAGRTGGHVRAAFRRSRTMVCYVMPMTTRASNAGAIRHPAPAACPDR